MRPILRTIDILRTVSAKSGAGGGIRTHEGLRHRVLSLEQARLGLLPIRPGSGTPAVPTPGPNPSEGRRDKLRLFAAGQTSRSLQVQSQKLRNLQANNQNITLQRAPFRPEKTLPEPDPEDQPRRSTKHGSRPSVTIHGYQNRYHARNPKKQLILTTQKSCFEKKSIRKIAQNKPGSAIREGGPR